MYLHELILVSSRQKSSRIINDGLYFLEIGYGPSERRYHVMKSKNGFLDVNLDIVTSNLCLKVNNKIASSQIQNFSQNTAFDPL